MKRRWDAHRIRYELALKGWQNLRDIDRKHLLPINTVNNTLCAPHLKGEQVIADILGVEPRTIWPNRYDSFGNRLRPQPRKNYKSSRRAGHCQKRRRRVA